MGNIEKYLNKIVDYMVRHTKDGELPFDNTTMSVSDFCKNTFGLTKYEIDYVWYRYKFLMGWIEGHDGSQYYLNKILNNY